MRSSNALVPRRVIGVLQLRRRRRRIAAVGCLVAGLAAAGIVGAEAFATKQAQGGPIAAVKAVAGPDATSTSSTSFVDLPGAATRIVVPRGQRGLILARFTAESQCSGPANAVCAVRIMIGPAGGEPSEIPQEFAFDQVGANGDEDLNEAHAMDRWKVLGPGTWTVRVQYAVNNAGAAFALDDWTLIVERSAKT